MNGALNLSAKVKDEVPESTPDVMAQAQQLLQASLLQQSLAAAGMWNMNAAVAVEANRAAHLQSQAALAEQAQILLTEVGPAATIGVEALRRGGRCGWPRCDAVVDSAEALQNHLSREHPLDARLLAAARLQLEMTRQLEAQAALESARLGGIVAHLQTLLAGFSSQPPEPPTPVQRYPQEAALLSAMMGLATPPAPPVSQPQSPAPGAVRRKQNPSTPILDKSSLSLGGDLNKNREFYRTSSEIRPPFTYASLIRQAILESPNMQLTLNEIYQWFQTEFAYFRRNEATWKNAVRHNLSLHKCFMRVENVKGAVWTVDETEFHRRRPQRVAGLRGALDVKEEDLDMEQCAPVFPRLSPEQERASTSGCSGAQSPEQAGIQLPVCPEIDDGDAYEDIGEVPLQMDLQP